MSNESSRNKLPSFNTSKKVFTELNKWLFIRYKFFKENLPMLIILPTILGGIWQVIELAKIDPSYIRLFSINQLVPDGVSIIFVGLVGYIIFLLVKLNYYVFSKKVEWFIGQKIPFLLTISIPPFFLLLYYYPMIMHKKTLFFSDLIFNIFFISFIITILTGLIKILEAISYKMNFKLLINNYNFRKFMLIFLLLLISLPLISTIKNWRYLTLSLNNLNNELLLKNRIKEKLNLKQKPELIYYTRDFLFYKIDEGKIQVLETKELFEK